MRVLYCIDRDRRSREIAIRALQINDELGTAADRDRIAIGHLVQRGPESKRYELTVAGFSAGGLFQSPNLSGLNASTVIPEPIFAWNGPRRVEALITRLTSICSTVCEIEVRKIGNESIRKPGLTPVPSTVLPAFLAAASSAVAAASL